MLWWPLFLVHRESSGVSGVLVPPADFREESPLFIPQLELQVLFTQVLFIGRCVLGLLVLLHIPVDELALVHVVVHVGQAIFSENSKVLSKCGDVFLAKALCTTDGLLSSVASKQDGGIGYILADRRLKLSIDVFADFCHDKFF